VNLYPVNPGVDALLEQTEWWFGADGYPYRVSNMDAEHIRNLLAFLERRAASLLRRRHWFEAYASGQSEAALLDRWSRELGTSSPFDWLRQRPLVRALEAELRRRDSIDGEVVDRWDDGPWYDDLQRRDQQRIDYDRRSETIDPPERKELT
jgi:hypothetical protein